MCMCAPQARVALGVCVQLIYKPQRKQNCRSHPQISSIKVLVTDRHAMNSQEQAASPSLGSFMLLLLK